MACGHGMQAVAEEPATQNYKASFLAKAFVGNNDSTNNRNNKIIRIRTIITITKILRKLSRAVS